MSKAPFSLTISSSLKITNNIKVTMFTIKKKALEHNLHFYIEGMGENVFEIHVFILEHN